MSTSFFQFYSLTHLFLLKAWFPYDRYDRCDRCDRWKKSSAIAAIIAIIWKPGLSYASLLNKIRFKYLVSRKGVSCCSLIRVFFTCWNEKGLLNFVSERIKLVYRMNNTRYNLKKNKLPFKHLKLQLIGRILSN